jgi:hypothetical protein
VYRNNPQVWDEFRALREEVGATQSKIEEDNINIEIYDRNKKFETNKLSYLTLLTLLVWIIIEKLIDSYFVILQDLDFWIFELLIISILNSRKSRIPIYKHQIFSIILYFFDLIIYKNN